MSITPGIGCTEVILGATWVPDTLLTVVIGN